MIVFELAADGKIVSSTIMGESSVETFLDLPLIPPVVSRVVREDIPQGTRGYIIDEIVYESPGAEYEFDRPNLKWKLSLPYLKDQWKAAVNNKRTQIEFGPFVYSGMLFDGDLNAQRRLGTYISLSKSAKASGETFTAEFILYDNSVVTLTEDDFINIEIAKASQVALAFSQAAAIKQQIDAATSVEELGTIIWEPEMVTAA